MRCLLCHKELGEGSIRDILIGEDPLCQNCRKQWHRYDLNTKIQGIKIHSIYQYEDAFATCLIQYKECYDEALKDVFLFESKKQIKRKYQGYTLCLLPSTKQRIVERGFSHLKLMFQSVGLPMLEPFEKKDELSQKNQNYYQRQNMTDSIVLKEGIELPKKILLCDDVITTGATIKGALKALQGQKCKVEILVVACAHQYYS